MKFPRASPSVSHVALLTPYDGGNLGDAAIQEALISNFRRFHSPLQISGITLDPERTAALHGIPCYLLAINSRPHYKVKTRSATESTDDAKTNLPDETGSEVDFFSRLRRRARLSAFLKPIRALFRLAKECRHVLQSYLLLREVDLLVVAGGGQLDEEWGGIWGHPYALMKWSVLARLAGAKTVFLSVGSCRIESRVSRKFVQMALSFALYRSYRDQGSREIALGISPAADGPVVPDLAFSLPSTRNEPLSETIRKPLHVGVSPIAFSRPGLWPTERAAAYERYMTELGAFVTWLLSRGASVTLFSRAALLGRPLDALVIQLLNFSEKVGARMDHLPNGSQGFKKLLRMSWRSLIIGAVANSHEYFSPAFIEQAESWSPFRFAFLRARNQRLTSRQGLYATLFEAFLESRESGYGELPLPAAAPACPTANLDA